MSTGFRTDIQGMRALAVVSVIAAHIALYQAGHGGRILGGFIGVDVFFVLSGYLITTLLLREVDRTGRVSLTGFYARRAGRILPAATLVLVVVVMYAAWQLTDVERSQFTRDAGWSVAFLANWHFAQTGVNYFDTSALSPLQHFWSLAVEEQFYLVWPLLIGLLAPRLRRTWLAVVVAAICAASVGWAIFVTSLDGAASAHEAYFSSPARAYELGIGALLAIAMPRLTSIVGRSALGLAGLVAIGACVVLFPADAAFPGWEALVPCVATAALIVAGAGGTTAVTRALSIRPLRFLGDISYSAYLWHFPVIVFASTLFPRSWHLGVLIPVEVAVMLALSAASYYLVERPFHTGRVPLLSVRRQALALWPLALAFVFGAAALGSAHAAHERDLRNQAAAHWYSTHLTSDNQAAATKARATSNAGAALTRELQQAIALADRGAPFPAGLDLSQTARPQPGNGYMCFAGDGQARLPRPCVYGDMHAKWVVALVGDSHVGMLIPFFDVAGKQDHFKVVMLQKLGCGPYDVQQRALYLQGECDQFRTWTTSRLRALRPNVIVLYGRGFLDVAAPPGRTIATTWRLGEMSAVSRLKGLAPRIVMVGDVPDRGQQPLVCIEANSREQGCMVGPYSLESESNVVTAAVARSEHVGYVPMQQFVCIRDQCPLVVGSRIVYWDDSHLSRTWMNHIYLALLQRFGPLIEEEGSGRVSS